MEKKNKLWIAFLLVAGMIVTSYNVFRINEKWHSVTIKMKSAAKETLVFHRIIDKGEILRVRLDLKPDAEGYLILVPPSGKPIRWMKSFRENQEELELRTETSGTYTLKLVTDMYSGLGTPPEIEVDWVVKDESL